MLCLPWFAGFHRPRRCLRACTIPFLVTLALATALSVSPAPDGAAPALAQSAAPFCRPPEGATAADAGSGRLQFGGALGAVALADGRAYVGQGARVAVYDVADLQAPRLLCTTALLTDAVRALAAVDGRVYALVNRYGQASAEARSELWVLASGPVALPNGLDLLGKVDLPGSFWKLTVGKDLAYLHGIRGSGAERQAGLAMVDVSNPREPRDLGAFVQGSEGSLVDDAAIDSDLLVTASFWGGLSVYDIAIPTQPRLLGSLWAPAGPDGPEAGVTHVSLHEGRALVLVWNVLHAVDLREPSLPREIARFPALGKIGAFGSKDGRGLAFHDGGRIALLDVSEPTVVRELADLTVVDELPSDLAIAFRDGRASWITTAGTLRLMDLTTTAMATSTVEPALPFAADVLRAGPHTLVAGGASGLWAVDLVRGRPPQRVQIPAQERPASGFVGTVTAADGYAFAFDGWGADSRIHVIDIDDTDWPVWLATLPLPAPADKGVPSYQMAVHDGHLYVPFGDHLTVFDVRRRGKPEIVTTLDLPGAMAAIQRGDHLFVGTEPPSRYAAVEVFDLARPDLPARVGGVSFNSSRVAELALTDDDRLLVATGPRLYAFDVAQPSRPAALGKFLDFKASSLAIDGNLLFVDALTGVAMHDLTGFPTLPQSWAVNLPGGIHLPNRPYTSHRIALDESRILDARGELGLFVLERPDAAPPGPEPEQPRLYLPLLTFGR